MKRHLVVTSHLSLSAADDAIERGLAAERKRLNAYLYGHSELVAAVLDVTPGRFVFRALVTVEADDADRCRYLADYQSDRLRSGSFGVEDYVEDELSARRAVGLAEEVEEPTLAEALAYAAACLETEEVEYALGLDEDHLDCSYVEENGVERPRTEADLEEEIARHRAFIKVLAEAAKNAAFRP